MCSNELTGVFAKLEEYSSTASSVLETLQKHNYAALSCNWDTPPSPNRAGEIAPPLSELYARLEAFTTAAEGGTSLDESVLAIHLHNIRVSRDRMSAAKAMRIPIEPIRELTEHLERLGYSFEAAKIRRVYDFVLALRRLYRQMIGW